MATAQDRPGAAQVPAPPGPPASRQVNRTRRAAWIGFWVGLLVVVFWVFMAWGPANDGARSIGDTGEFLMMTGAAVLGVSIIILLQEATGTGYE